MTYKLFKYTVYADSEVEDVVFEHEDEDVVAQKALELSKLENFPYTAFRMEKWNNNEQLKGWRFFSRGTEFTDMLRRAALEGLKEIKKKHDRDLRD